MDDYFLTTILFRVIRLPAVFFLTALMLVSVRVCGQGHITIKANRLPVQKLFKQLQKQHGYSFFYKTEMNKDLPRVTIDVRNATIVEVLQQCFKGTAFDYMVVDKTVVIRRKVVGAPTTQVPPQDMIRIRGQVLDQEQVPLSGVTIRLEGSNMQWVTDKGGNFTALITPNTATLQLSYIGYQNKEVTVGNSTKTITIVLDEDNSKLDEIQVIAYGTSSRRYNTGNITTVESKEIEKYPVTNVLEVLQGLVPGMDISRTSGNPGSALRVMIRGRNGIDAGSGSLPLYVIDGIPYQGGAYSLQNPTLGRISLGGDALNFVNPLDIESISVLKDADATSIYGSRAVNGVVLITTRKGKAANTKISVNMYSGYSRVSKFPDMLNIAQYLEMRREAKRNDNSPISATDYDINGTWDTTRNVNLADEVLGGTAYISNIQASISGGTAAVQYLLSGNFNHQKNIFRQLGGQNRTANLHFNITTASANKKFSVQINGGYLHNNNTIPPTDLTGYINLAPNTPEFYTADGTLNFANNTFANPLVVKNEINHSPAANITSSMALSYKPLPRLEFRTVVGYNKQQVNEFLGQPVNSYQPLSNQIAQALYTYNNNTSWSLEPQVNYNETIGSGTLLATLGGSLQKQVTESTRLRVTGFANDAMIRDRGAGTTVTAVAPYYKVPYKYNALFGRLNYNLAGKYILNVSGRYDGSSKFGENKQFHLFGAAGAAWIFSEEAIFKEVLPWISFGKFRASYGVTGNDQIPAYVYLENYTSTARPYQGLPGVIPNNIPNPDLSWETTRKIEAAVELQFLKGLIIVDAAFYRNRSTDLIGQYPLSAVTGFSSIITNQAAKVQNKGMEIMLSTHQINTVNFSWSSGLLFTRQRNKLLAYPNLEGSSMANTLGIGLPVSISRAFRYAGVNTQTGLYEFYDLNGKVVSLPSAATDMTALINVDPDFFGSLKNSFRYKQFTLDILFRFIKKKGKNVYGQMDASIPPGATIYNFTTLVLDRWQKPGDVTNVQRYGLSVPLILAQLNANQSDRSYGDASYIRFQNLSFGYQFPQAALNKLRLENLRLFIQGENLFTISKHDGLDPESLNGSALPILRTLTTGLQVTF